MFWKISLVVLAIAVILLFAVVFVFGLDDNWKVAEPLTYVALSCIIAGIAIYPLAVREPGLSYWGVLRKYFF